VTLFRWNSRTPLSSRRVEGAVGASLAPDGRLAVVVARAGRSELRVDGRVLFTGPGRFTDVAWSPDGRWLLVAWADADQWVFLRSSGARDVQAVSRISTQFRATAFPAIGGWCCPERLAGPSNTVSLGPSYAWARVVPPPEAPPQPSNTVLRGDVEPAVAWRRSTSVGLPWAGRLERGVRLPAEGKTFFTWDPVLRRAPNRNWRRVGTDRLVRMVLRILDEFAAAHPEAPRIGVGDLSRSQGGDFGPRYGLPGHVSHQNGLDVDLYYPRRDRRERPPARPSQMDRELAQDLVDRFVAAGALKVFVGPNVGLTGPPKIVQALPHHDNHLHVRIARPR
jgi:Penicillin-insensitive murein endopeptidase/WD40-like Beta Propeller Repeat